MKKMKKGFTIVELVIVIGVIAILSAVLIPTFVNLSGKAKVARAQSEVADAYTAYIIEKGDKALPQSEVLAKYTYGSDAYFFLYDSTDGWKNQNKDFDPATNYEASAISPDGNSTDHVEFFAKKA